MESDPQLKDALLGGTANRVLNDLDAVAMHEGYADETERARKIRNTLQAGVAAMDAALGATVTPGVNPLPTA